LRAASQYIAAVVLVVLAASLAALYAITALQAIRTGGSEKSLEVSQAYIGLLYQGPAKPVGGCTGTASYPYVYLVVFTIDNLASQGATVTVNQPVPVSYSGTLCVADTSIGQGFATLPTTFSLPPGSRAVFSAIVAFDRDPAQHRGVLFVFPVTVVYQDGSTFTRNVQVSLG